MPRTLEFKHCPGCNRPLRPNGLKVADYPGTVQVARRGRCATCVKAAGLPSKTQTKYPCQCSGCNVTLRPPRATAAEYPGSYVPYRSGMCRACSRRDAENDPPAESLADDPHRPARFTNEQNIQHLEQYMARRRARLARAAAIQERTTR